MSKTKITTEQLLIPVSILSFTLLFLFLFQISQIMNDRDSLNQTLGRMEQPFAQSQNVNKQFGGLVAGSQKLAQEGNKSVQEIVAQLKKMGIIVEPPVKVTEGQVPGANAVPPKGLVKP